MDYLENDFAACVACGGVIEKGVLHYAFVTDCGVCVFDEKGKLRFRTKNEGPNKKISAAIGKKPEKYGSGWKDPRWRARTRSWYRNNPKEPLSYGAFTGEGNAMYFVRVGKIKLNKGDYEIK